MLKWFALALGVLATVVVGNYMRWWILPRRRLCRFLSARGVHGVEIRKGGSYGWPGYRLVFDSAETRKAFEGSPVFDALLRELDKMHGGLRHGPRQFDAKLAVSLAP
jgi:hypothetical protein